MIGVGSLWYHHKGGEKVTKEDETKRFNRQLIDGAENKIRIDTEAVLLLLEIKMEAISNLLINVTSGNNIEGLTEGKILEESITAEMATYVSEIGIEERSLLESVVELAQNTLGLARCPFEATGSNEASTKEKRPMPMSELTKLCLKMASDSAGVPSEASILIANIGAFSAQLNSNGSYNVGTIESCCSLVISACNLESSAVTEKEWDDPKNKDSPGGMIGQTYSILQAKN
jgi:hypothetical protein